ncbi:MAG: hypothetical protein IPL61_30875 [Myxococcales bacterium]|nr:hypothetical protein [Myxococcales bacterium]
MSRSWFVIGALSLLVASCGGDDGQGAPVDAGLDAPAGPTAADIRFTPIAALPSGAWLLYNDWSTDPNRLYALPASDLGGARRELFQANRVWAFGARADGSEVLFSAWDAEQEAHFGVTIGDAIQNTFAYDTATQAVRAVSWGNQNDECHTFAPDGATAFVCRRYDFQPDTSYRGWRLGRLQLADGSFEFVRAEQSTQFEFHPTPVPGTSQLLFELRDKPPASGSTIWSRDLMTGVETMVKASARRPTLAPDGARLLFQNAADRNRWYVMDLAQPATPAALVSATLGVGSARWAPDGAAIVYTVSDDANSCDDLETVAIAGLVAATPARVRVCATGDREFITNIAWVVVP